MRELPPSVECSGEKGFRHFFLPPLAFLYAVPLRVMYLCVLFTSSVTCCSHSPSPLRHYRGRSALFFFVFSLPSMLYRPTWRMHTFTCMRVSVDVHVLRNGGEAVLNGECSVVQFQ